MKDDRLYLIHIRECMEKIRDYTEEGEGFFRRDNKTQDAVIRNFEIIGEAAKRVSQELRDQTPNIPWQRISGFRDVLIHQYEGVDLDQVWKIVERDMTDLEEKIGTCLSQWEGSEEEDHSN